MKTVNSIKELVAEIKSQLNLKPGDIVNFTGPQFNREYDLEIKWHPETTEEFDTVCKELPVDILKKMGVCVHYKEKDKTLYLFPGEWYNFIPEGYLVDDVFGYREPFHKATNSPDIRYGCLCYGFTRK
jgi:hypothetical protein